MMTACASCPGHSTATGGKEKYRPAYLEHFEKKEQEEKARMSNKTQPMATNPTQQQQQQTPQPQQQQPPPKQVTPPHHFQRSFIDGDFEFVSDRFLLFVWWKWLAVGEVAGVCEQLG